MLCCDACTLCLCEACVSCELGGVSQTVLWQLWLPAVQAQCILFRRYPDVLEPFKYAGYPMLLQAVALPQQESSQPSSHFLGPEQAPRLQVMMLDSTCPESIGL